MLRPENSDHDGHTLSFAGCKTHPPFSEWPEPNLIRQMCPKCMHWVPAEMLTLRELKARRLLKERTNHA